MSVTLGACVRVSPEVLFQQVRGELILLDLNGEKYYGLNEVGGRIWELLDGAHTLTQIAQTVSSEFDATPSQVQDDLLALVESLREAGLVTVLGE